MSPADASDAPASPDAPDAPVLVTGATGYVGARLVPRLLAEGYAVRILTRSADKVRQRAWFDQVKIVEGDATDDAVLARACAGVGGAYYLLHSMDGQGDFVQRDRELAHRFGAAARDAGLTRLVYLSGLHPDEPLSEHLASRVEVGRILLASGVPTAVLQAAVVVGSGSASFEMLRHLTNRLPVMVTPKWLDNQIQPIAIADVLDALVVSAGLPSDVNRTFDIAGPDVLTYRQMIQQFASVAGLFPRVILGVPVLTPFLASHWVGFVTPVPTGLAKPLVGSLLHEVVAHEDDLADYGGRPRSALLSYRAALEAALADATDGLGRVGQRPEPGTCDPAHITAADPDWAGPQ